MIYQDRKESSIEKKAKKTQGKTFGVRDIDVTILETIRYEYPQNKITVCLQSDEFTCICPYSGLPDFARLRITYIPRKKLIELKSLKYYLYAFRNVKVYNEHAVNKILIDLKKILNPHQLNVEAEFSNRGGITNKVSASYQAKR
jgi:7-cyano-7-deazaguanine reductase